MELLHILRELGLSEREIAVYLVLLSGGPAPIRQIGRTKNMARTTVIEALTSLRKAGLVTSFQKHKKEYYLAEDPEKLVGLLEKKERSFAVLKRNLAETLPELRSLYAHNGKQSTLRYYEGSKGLAIVLEDVLRTMSAQADKTYRAYSSASMREHLYKDFQNFTKDRIGRRIQVRVIAIGAGGGEQPLSSRRWLESGKEAPSYVIIYGHKVAFFSLDKSGEPLGVVIEDERVAETERMVFDHVWKTLELVPAVAHAVASKKS